MKFEFSLHPEIELHYSYLSIRILFKNNGLKQMIVNIIKTKTKQTKLKIYFTKDLYMVNGYMKMC